MVNLSQALRLNSSTVAAFVGAGGKTSAMFLAARELGNALITTTTHLGNWQNSEANFHLIWEPSAPMPDFEGISAKGIVLITGTLDEKKHRYRGLQPQQLEKLHQYAGYHDIPLLIEADGSRQLSLKAPGEFEPVIPAFVNLVVVVAGMSGLGNIISNETVFRAEKYRELTGLQEKETITTDNLAAYLLNPQGGLKNIPMAVRRVVLLNQSDMVKLQSAANEMSIKLLWQYDAVIISSLRPEPVKIYAVKENVAAVIICNDNEIKPKKVTNIHYPSLSLLILKKMIILKKAGVTKIVIVCRENIEEIVKVTEGISVIVKKCGTDVNYFSEAIKSGLEEISSPVGSVFVLKADETLFNKEMLNAMVENHSQNMLPILMPYFFDKRLDIYLFDHIIIPEIIEDYKKPFPRTLFSRYSPKYINWYDKTQA